MDGVEYTIRQIRARNIRICVGEKRERMLTPDYLLHISEGAEEIAETLHQYIVNRIVEAMMYRVGRGDDYLLTAKDKWMIEVLQDAGFMLEDIQKEIAKRTKQQMQEIKEAMEQAGVDALAYDDTIYRRAGISTIALDKSPHLIRLMQRNYEATLGEWRNFTRTMANESQKLFVREMDKAYNLVTSGTISYTQAVREAVNTIASEGVIVRYPSGREDTIETATLRAVRTGVSQATAQIQLARAKEEGVKLVLTSSHAGARPSHAKWQGHIFSVDWNDFDSYTLKPKNTPINHASKRSKYPDFVKSTRYGYVDGLCGANCRHNFSVYYDGMKNPFEKFDTEENKKAYELSQHQRTLERRIRATKRDVMAKKTAVDNAKSDEARKIAEVEYQKKAALLQKQNAAYNDFCEKNDLKKLSDRIQIAKWSRKQAAAARGAAKRYNNAKEG